MNIDEHMKQAKSLLDLARDKVDRKDYVGAQRSIAQAYSHSREILDHVGKLVILKAEIKDSAEETTG